VTKWEYRVVPIFAAGYDSDESAGKRDQEIENCLSNMGKEGWELISFLPEVRPPDVVSADWAASTSMYHAIFKRLAE
jgi:uncharacterized protein DUF4177